MKNTRPWHWLWGLLAFCIVCGPQRLAAQNVSELTSGIAYYIKCGGSDNGAKASPFLYDDSGTLKAQAFSARTDATLWLVTAVSGKDGYYTVKNKSTGRYLAPVSSKGTTATLQTASAEVYIGANDKTGSSDPWFNIKASADNSISYNMYGTGQIGGWAANNGNSSGLSNSEWGFWKCKEAYLEEKGFAVPTASETQLYRVANQKNASYALAEDASGGLVSVDYTSSDNDGDFSQYWYLVSQSDGKTAFLNALTGNYVQSLSGTKDAQYKTGITPYGFTVADNANHLAGYDIRDNTTLGFNSTDKSAGSATAGGGTTTGQIYSWTFYDGSNDLNSLWNFYAVTLTSEQQEALAAAKVSFDKQKALKTVLAGGKLRIRTARNASTNAGYYTDAAFYITDNDGSEKMQTLLSGDDADKQIWIAEGAGDGGYTFRNLATGKYLDFYNSNASAKTLYVRYYPGNADTESYVNLSANSDFSGDGNRSDGGAIHAQGDGYSVVPWEPSAGTGSNWTFESVELTDDAVRAAFDNLAGILSDVPAEGVYVRLRSAMYPGESLTDNSDKLLTHEDTRSKDALQLWSLTPVSGMDGCYQLANALTGQYVSIVSANNNTRCTTQDGEAVSGDYAGLKVARTSKRFESRFTVAMPSNTGQGLHAQPNTGSVVIWTTSAQGSEWYFVASDMTDAEIAAQKTAYAALNAELGNIDTYNAVYPTFFTDAYCTELADAYKDMTDDALRSALAAAGVDSETLQAAAVKAKNASWAKWEKIFRVRDVNPYSAAGTWNNLLKIGNEYTSLSNPTGIWTNPYEPTYIYVGADIPDGATLKLRSVLKTDSQGSEIATLKKGLNVVSAKTSGALYFVYTVTTDLSDTSKKLADYPALPVHVEGGSVDGYFDATRAGIDTDEAWKEMVEDGLFSKSMAMMKGRHLIYQLNSTLTKQYVPEKMREIVDFWDWMMDVFHEKMAINDYYDRWNNVNGFYSCTYNYMFATTYGTYYNENTLSSVLNYDNMAAGGGSLWGPAHENGHNHQSMINMIGCTEISNNLFSQIIVHLNGKTSTRLNGRKFKDIADLYAAGTSWHDYNLWDRNTLYLKLYLYYEVAGYKPDFCRALFRALRSDPLNHSTGSASNPTPASGDFLKFALKCCEVTGDDLSEFFRAFGFFVPFETREIGDYATYYTVNTQEMIDAAIAEMHTYAKPKGNILFIENHIKHEPAIDHDGNYLYNADGSQVLRTDYNDEDAVGKCGDVGSYSDYAEGKYASGYTYSQSDNTLTMSGEGAVGYKVYDSDGTLLYFSNQNTFTLPASVVAALSGKTMVVKAAQPDGTDITLPAAGADTWELKVYHADALSADKSNTVYTDGTAATIPVLTGNALAFVQPKDGSALPSALAETANVVDATDADAPRAANVVITDKTAFYSPSDFTADKITYARTNTAGWNSVCLPFAVSASDFGEGSRIETLYGANYGGGTEAATIGFKTLSGENPAGQPCLVYCPDDVTEWSVTKTDAEIVAEPVEVSADGVTMTGSYLNAAIGAGKYKLSSDGTAFGITSDKGKVYAFRSYVTAASGTSGLLSFAVSHDSGTFTGIDSASRVADAPAAVYDLTGRRVANPVKGTLYIVNGRKAIAQ